MAANIPNQNQFQQYLIQQLNANTVGIANAIIEAGIDTYETFADFDDDEMKNVCYTLRKPGGMVQRPFGPNNAMINIPNPGVPLTSVCEMRLRLASYAARYYATVGRLIDADSMSWLRIKHFKTMQKIIKNHVEPENLPEISKRITIVKALELVEEYLRGVLGVEKVPLSYIIRKDVVPVFTNVNNPLSVNLPYGTEFNSYFEEMIQMAPHNTPAYAEDNARVMNILIHVMKGTSFEVSITPHKQSRDGRSAFLALTQHNLGTNRWERILETADNLMNSVKWNGRSARYSLKAHVSKHREAFNNMLKASQNIPYQVPNEATRVRRFLHSLESSDQRIISAKTSILADANMKNDFEAMSNFLMIVAPPIKQQQDNHRVSAQFVKTENKGKETGVELRFHTSDEYNKLTGAQKRELYAWRHANDNKSTPKGRDDKTQFNLPSRNSRYQNKRRKISALTAEIDELKQTISSMSKNDDTNVKEEDTSKNSSANRKLVKPAIKK